MRFISFFKNFRVLQACLIMVILRVYIPKNRKITNYLAKVFMLPLFKVLATPTKEKSQRRRTAYKRSCRNTFSYMRW